MITYSNKEVELAIGVENGEWYVQTTDLKGDTYYSESIAEGCYYEQALSILKVAIEDYNMKYQNWSSYPVSEDIKNA